jgi:predicted phage tail protein
MEQKKKKGFFDVGTSTRVFGLHITPVWAIGIGIALSVFTGGILAPIGAALILLGVIQGLRKIYLNNQKTK